MIEKDHICVCICTYKRPELLMRLLSKLERQATGDAFSYSIVIVDNDGSESARHVVETYARSSEISISYYVEPERNISLARNKAIENAKGDFIGLIDDDELPVEDWLSNLYEALNSYNTDGVLGPVNPRFETEPPDWVLRAHLFDRAIHPSGHILEWKDTRTGNALLKQGLFKPGDGWFDPRLGSGGEDREFFRARISEGYVFVWCNEAPVCEVVPPKRWQKTVLAKRALLRGKMALNATKSRPESLLISLVAFTVYTFCLPLFLVLGYHVFVQYLIKTGDHLGKLLAFLGIDCVKEKYV